MAKYNLNFIDKETARDVYYNFMDAYDNGDTIEQLESNFPVIKDDFFNNPEKEVYVLACGLAHWEIGILNVGKLNFIKEVVEQEISIKELYEKGIEEIKDLKEKDKDEALAYLKKEIELRRKITNDYLQKLSSPNTNIRQRVKYTKIKNFYFKKNDLISCKLNDGKYIVFLCINSFQKRSEFFYVMALSTFVSDKKPNISQIKNSYLLGGSIDLPMKSFMELIERDIESITDIEDRILVFDYYSDIAKKDFDTSRITTIIEKIASGKSKASFNEMLIEHKFIEKNLVAFEKIGTLKILDEKIIPAASFGFYNDLYQIEEAFYNIDKTIFKHDIKYPFELLCEF